ncbi:hypothetical protein [Nicoliella lavandulae]|uniref:DUF302 domain-containing protein n=1 Tax=Nicoliella lavandulae TaxID=3082954 RepID=A0ABU8SJL0_9LACO
MEIDAQKFIDQITDEDFKSTNFTVERANLEQDIKQSVGPMVQFIAEQIQSGAIAQARLEVADADTQFRLETSIINLPLRYAKAISKIMSGDGQQPVNVYMIVESPDVNRSKLRIDEVATADEFVAQQAAAVTRIADWMHEQLAKIDASLAAGTEEAEETE